MADDMERWMPSTSISQPISQPLLGFSDWNLTPTTTLSPFEPKGMLGGPVSGMIGGSGMPLDVVENKENFCVKANVPGFAKDDIVVSVDNNVLTIACDKEDVKEQEGDNWMRKERWQGSTRRSFTLPESVAEDKITAEHKDGVLKVCLQKKNEYKGLMGTQSRLKKGAKPITIC